MRTILIDKTSLFKKYLNISKGISIVIILRQVIPYIASQFRKDKIWLRRTKPSKREYQIILAIDNSSSMSDNHSKEVS